MTMLFDMEVHSRWAFPKGTLYILKANNHPQEFRGYYWLQRTQTYQYIGHGTADELEDMFFANYEEYVNF